MTGVRATKILAIHFKYLGDAAIVTPALRAIKEHFPHCALHVLTPAEFAPIYQYLPWLDKVWGVPRSRGRARLKDTWPIIRALRRERFDRSVDFVGNDRGAILSLLCGARQRLGPTAAGGFFGRRFCYTERIEERSLDRAWLQRCVQVLAVWGVQPPRSSEMEVRADPKLDQFAEQLLPDKKIVCYLATGQAKKDWPIAHWAGFHKSASAAGLELVFMSGNSARERSLLEALRKSAPGISVLPVLPDVAALLAVLKRGRLFISGDTGPFHCAAGLGVPVIGLFGTDNSLAHAAPLYRSEQVIRGGTCTCDGHSDTCYSSQPCMAAISADDLLRRVRQVLASV